MAGNWMPTKAELLKFIDAMRAAGRVAPTTAAGMRSAVGKVLVDGKDFDNLDWKSTKSRLKGVEESSLRSYMQRTALVLKLYAEWERRGNAFMQAKGSQGREQGGMLSHTFPLRPGLDARVELPRDLSADEAERICALVKALAVPSK